MQPVTATQLAKEIGVTKGRVSQMVSSGQLDGCFSGEGRARRFDVAKVANVLGQRLDQGQMLGNGASTQDALTKIRLEQKQQLAELPLGSELRGTGATKVSDDDQDGYQMARTEKAIQEARKLRRMNAEAEGLYVLVSEVELQVKQMMAQEIAEFEQVMRVGARAVADEFGADFKSVRKILLDTWREHRGRRSKQLAEAGQAVELSKTEKEEDI